jgi:Tetracyclin repressor-like, C-terminal domain
VLAEFTAQRRAALRALLERGQVSGDLCANANLDLLVDVFYGVPWYRLLASRAAGLTCGPRPGRAPDHGGRARRGGPDAGE